LVGFGYLKLTKILQL